MIIVIIYLVNKNGKLKIQNQSLYENHDICVEVQIPDDGGKIISINVNYFIQIWREEGFTLNSQLGFIKKSLSASGYGTNTFRESAFRALIRDRGFESVTMVRR